MLRTGTVRGPEGAIDAPGNGDRLPDRRNRRFVPVCRGRPRRWI